jgi:hypothetical protein
MNMNQAYEKFFKKCITELGVDRAQCRMDQNWCQIRTVKGWVVHYEWRLARNNNLQVGLHFESNDRALNQRRYGACASIIDTLNGEIDKNFRVIAGRRGKRWFGLTISRKLDFVEKDAVVWAVSVMRMLRKVSEKAVEELD